MIRYFIGFSGIPNPNIESLDRLLKRSENLVLHPMSYLAALMTDIDDVTMLNSRLKFSGYERDMTYFIVEHRDDKDSSRPLM